MMSYLRYLAYAAVLGVLFAAWRIELQNTSLKQANKNLRAAQDELFASSGRPLLIRGFSLPILDHADIIEQFRAERAPKRQLILFYRASCQACERQIPYWERLLDDVRLSDIEVWLVSIGDGGNLSQGMVRILKKRRLPYRLLRVRSAMPFTIATGIAGVPVTIVGTGEGEESLLEFVEPGLADEQRLDLILDGITAGKRAVGARVLSFGQIDPLGED
jgi:hypothetical protein